MLWRLNSLTSTPRALTQPDVELEVYKFSPFLQRQIPIPIAQYALGRFSAGSMQFTPVRSYTAGMSFLVNVNPLNHCAQRYESSRGTPRISEIIA